MHALSATLYVCCQRDICSISGAYHRVASYGGSLANMRRAAVKTLTPDSREGGLYTAAQGLNGQFLCECQRERARGLEGGRERE